jgi:hypothetical protein
MYLTKSSTDITSSDITAAKVITTSEALPLFSLPDTTRDGKPLGPDPH